MASYVTSALRPERVTGPYAGYDIVDVERLGHAFAPALEHVRGISICFSWSEDAGA
jgi:hypothetical protein